MELSPPANLGRTATPAPALSRGLALLAALDAQPLQTLEALASRLELPKTSVYRLLTALQQIGMVRKTPDKRYEVLWTLRPLHDGSTLFRERLFKALPTLCVDTKSTIEWHEPVAEGMKIIWQENPDVELRLQARPGSVRKWERDLDAVISLGYAFYPDAPKPKPSVRIYVSNGVSRPATQKEAARLIADAKETHIASDPAFNIHAIRRHAIAVFRDEKFLGVLALAESYRFQRPHPASFFIGKLQEFLSQLRR